MLEGVSKNNRPQIRLQSINYKVFVTEKRKRGNEVIVDGLS